jgi:hypothetical protein
VDVRYKVVRILHLIVEGLGWTGFAAFVAWGYVGAPAPEGLGQAEAFLGVLGLVAGLGTLLHIATHRITGVRFRGAAAAALHWLMLCWMYGCFGLLVGWAWLDWPEPALFASITDGHFETLFRIALVAPAVGLYYLSERLDPWRSYDVASKVAAALTKRRRPALQR